MVTTPLWQRALEARAVESLRDDGRVRRLKTNPSIGQGRRLYALPRVGDVLGDLWAVVESMGRGRGGRKEMTFGVRCVACTHERVVFEAHLRRPMNCSRCLRRDAR